MDMMENLHYRNRLKNLQQKRSTRGIHVQKLLNNSRNTSISFHESDILQDEESTYDTSRNAKSSYRDYSLLDQVKEQDPKWIRALIHYQDSSRRYKCCDSPVLIRFFRKYFTAWKVFMSLRSKERLSRYYLAWRIFIAEQKR